MKTLEQCLAKCEYWEKEINNDNYALIQSEVAEYSSFIRALLEHKNIAEFSADEIVSLKRLQATVDSIKSQLMLEQEGIADKLSRLQEGRRMNRVYQAHR